MNPKDNPNHQASNSDKRHSPEKGATQPDQQANAAREDAGKAPLPKTAAHDLHSEADAKAQAAHKPAANPERPTVSPASGQQTSANLVQTATAVGFGDPAVDGKRTGTITIHVVIQPNDPRSEAAIVYAALQDEFEKAKAGAQ